MKHFIIAMALISSISLGAQPRSEIIPSSALPSERCDVRTSFGFSSYSGRCSSRDEVMVGIQSTNPLIIRCARIEVTCPNFEKLKEDIENEQED